MFVPKKDNYPVSVNVQNIEKKFVPNYIQYLQTNMLRPLKRRVPVLIEKNWQRHILLNEENPSFPPLEWKFKICEDQHKQAVQRFVDALRAIYFFKDDGVLTSEGLVFMKLFIDELRGKPFVSFFKTALTESVFTSHFFDIINNRFIVVETDTFHDDAIYIHNTCEFFDIMNCMDIDNKRRYSVATSIPLDHYLGFSWCFAVAAKKFVQAHPAAFAEIRFSGVWFLPELFYLLFHNGIYTNKKIVYHSWEMIDGYSYWKMI